MTQPQKQIEKIRKQPWDWKTKNEYEVVTVRQQPYLHGQYRHIYDERDYDIYDPRYTRLKCSDWEAFRDPKKYWYTSYVRDRKRLSEEVENAFQMVMNLELIESLPEKWVNAVRDIYTPLRHLEYGENVQMQYVIRYALGTPIEQCATFQAYDKVGRAQWISTWAMNMQEHHGEFLQHGKEVLLNEPSYQLLRRYVEEILITDDWAEVLVAQNLTLDLLLGNLMYVHFTEKAKQNGDIHLAGLNLQIDKQNKWHADWAFTLFNLLANDPAESRWDYLKSLGYEDWPGDYRWGRTLSDPRETPEETMTNLEIIQEWVDKWYPKAYEAVLSLQPLFDKHDIAFNIADVVDQIEFEVVQKRYQKLGITFNRTAVTKDK
ncbi:MAG: methane/phenol/toluene hydroxylase [Neobacillus sp.]|nr:methane/phenol/toluene hydroxylase [Neobacillus sp.]